MVEAQVLNEIMMQLGVYANNVRAHAWCNWECLSYVYIFILDPLYMLREKRIIGVHNLLQYKLFRFAHADRIHKRCGRSYFCICSLSNSRNRFPIGVESAIIILPYIRSTAQKLAYYYLLILYDNTPTWI